MRRRNDLRRSTGCTRGRECGPGRPTDNRRLCGNSPGARYPSASKPCSPVARQVTLYVALIHSLEAGFTPEPCRCRDATPAAGTRKGVSTQGLVNAGVFATQQRQKGGTLEWVTLEH